MPARRVVLATGNAGKLGEMRAILAGHGLEVVAQSELGIQPPVEDGESFVANALIKARHAAKIARLPAIADDSGIEVDALGGRPGVLSARFADGEAACNTRLLEELRDVPSSRRTARYRAVVALAFPDGRAVSADGTCEGSIGLSPRGTGGFGYDPLFVSAELGRVVGEIGAEEKARISHRARAMRALGAALQARGIVASL